MVVSTVDDKIAVGQHDRAMRLSGLGTSLADLGSMSRVDGGGSRRPHTSSRSLLQQT